jgi:hypothetical protein
VRIGPVIVLSAVLLGANASSSGWVGTWQDNFVIKMTKGAIPNIVTYTAEKGNTQLNGSCQYTGNRAVCHWDEKYSPPNYMVVIEGRQILILLGSSIMEHKIYDKATCANPEVAACKSAVAKIKGLVRDYRWRRIK